MIYLAQNFLSWELGAQIALFGIPAAIFLLISVWLFGGFKYNKDSKLEPINKPLAIVSLVLFFVVPIIILLIGLFTK